MCYFVYIIRSKVDGTLYKGYSADYLRRLKEHNEGTSRYTAKKIPWELIYVERFSSKTQASKRENKLNMQIINIFNGYNYNPGIF